MRICLFSSKSSKTMDFFSSGFQSLFNDLEQDALWENLETSSTDLQLVSCEYDRAAAESIELDFVRSDNNFYTCDYYSCFNQETGDTEWAPIFLETESANRQWLQKNAKNFDNERTTSTAENTEAEWEAKFLDDFIEVPECVVDEFLPEKTLLCNELCDDFLTESSDNLKLYRKTTTVAETAAANPSSGLACTFGNCTKVYAKPAHLKAHLRRHLGEKPYCCTWPDCSWKFSRSDELARHRRSHSGVKPYKCNYCSKSFARSDHLAKHRKVHERRLLAVSKIKGCCVLQASSIFKVRPGRKPKNLISSCFE